MADIRIVREHGLSLVQARQLALRWTQVAQSRLAMACSYAQGAAADTVSFERAGASGELRVTPECFALDARLGLLLGMFRQRIVSDIERNLDALLAQDDPLAAFESALAKYEARKT